MNMRPPTRTKNLDGYGAAPLGWARVAQVLEDEDGAITQAPGTGGPDRHTSWLATIQPDGRPHVVALGVLWRGDRLYFTANASTRKAKNLARDPRAVITVATQSFDLVVEGEAARVVDDDELAAVAAEYAKGGWPARVEGGSLTAPYSAPSAGPPPWDLYRLTPTSVVAMATTAPSGATRFDL
jgi:PPOX class probable F420-dependent enzyme